MKKAILIPLCLLLLALPLRGDGQQQNSNRDGQPAASSPLMKEAGAVRAAIRGTEQQPWRYSGFYVFEAEPQTPAPWDTFFKKQQGYEAVFLNPNKEVPNIGKGGGARGTHHPSFSVWLFPNVDAGTRKALGGRIEQRQMAQEPLPTIIGSNSKYVLAVVGETDDAEAQIRRIAAALKIRITRPEQ